MEAILSIVQVLIAISMIAIILIQRGPGAAAGSGFGAGASGTVFGSRGAGSFLTRTTAILAAGFLVVSMTMAVLASRTVQVQTTTTDLGVMGETDDAAGQLEVPALPGADSAEAAAPAGDDEIPAAPVSEDESEVPVQDEESP